MSRTSAEERRRQLADAAVAILIEEGPQALTTRAVARRAGTPLGTVHYAFAGKEELLAAAVGRILASFAAALEEEVDPTLGVRAAVAAALRGYWSWVGATPRLGTAVLETLVASLRTPEAGRTIEAAEGVVVELLERAARHDATPPRVSPGELARTMLVAADGLTLVHAPDPTGDRAVADLARVTAMIQALV